MSAFSCVVQGSESLLIQCSEILLSRGHRISAVVTTNREIIAWATEHAIPLHSPGADLAERLDPAGFDWFFSIANLAIVPDAVLALARNGAINFHDGPLPRYAGLNAPVWAIINREQSHGVSWHFIEGGIDEGDVVSQQAFDLTELETALTLNTKCYSAAIDSFTPLVTAIEQGSLRRQVQDLSERTYYAKDARPEAAGRLDFNQDADNLTALVRALDHGAYWNPLVCAKVEIGGRVVLVGEARIADEPGEGRPGTVLGVSEDGLIVATGTAPILVGQLKDTNGEAVAPASHCHGWRHVGFARPGDRTAIVGRHGATGTARWLLAGSVEPSRSC